MKDIYVDIRNENDTITAHFGKKDFVSIDELLGVIESLSWDVDRLQEELEDQEQYYKDNYKKIDDHEYYGVSKKEF